MTWFSKLFAGITFRGSASLMLTLSLISLSLSFSFVKSEVWVKFSVRPIPALLVEN